MRELDVMLVHARGENALFGRSFPGELLRGGTQKGVPFELELPLDPKELDLAEGSAFLRVTARDWSWRDGLRGNATRLEIPVTIDLTPPRVSVESGLTYVRRGGAAAVVYGVEEAVMQDGVEVGDIFFAGFGLPQGSDTRRLSIFAVSRNAPDDAAVRVVAVDVAGNRRTTGWATRIRGRRFEDVTLSLSDRFLEGKVRELAEELGIDASDPLEAFRQINTKVRSENEARIRELLTESAPSRLWEGAFLQLPNSKVTSRFAERRRYQVDRKEVSQAIHYGYDLASTAGVTIPAANRGRVVYAGDLGIYGQCVLIDHGLGVASLYGHLSHLTVAAGDSVEKGQSIGRSGETGLAGGDHLHFAILVGGVYVDPLEWWDAKWVRDHIESRIAAP
jgi:murein DD-endopeptidase MepM/ murein hydrolase activator NlpD